MKKYLLLSLFILTISSAFPLKSAAQPATIFRAYAGPLIHLNDDADNLFDTGVSYGAELVWDVQFKPTYSLEVAGGFTFYADDFNAVPGDPSPPFPGNMDLDITSFTLNLRNKFKLNERVFFNVGGGAGAYLTDQKLLSGGVRTEVEDDVFGFHFLAGLDFMLTDNLFLMGEFRYTFTDLELANDNIDFITFFFGAGIRL